MALNVARPRTVPRSIQVSASDRPRGRSPDRFFASGVVLLGSAVLAGLLGHGNAASGGLDVLVRDHNRKPLTEVVVYASSGVAAGTPARGLRAVVDQQDKEFVPHVKPVQVGTEIVFPNRDDIRHHVYSFSPAKKFELPLYKGTPAAPVKFDRPGVVVLGCNIHDWMIGYVLVLNTPFFGTTGPDGRSQLSVPAGTYDVRVWHASLRDEREAPSQRIVVGAAGASTAEFTLTLKPEWRPRRATSVAGDRYR
jgi:plastocyanin